MLSKVKSCGLNGVDGFIIDVECFVSNGIPRFDIVGLGDTAVKESKERVRAAIKNSGLMFPSQIITLNLAPANIKKEGSSLDLAIAIGILSATRQIRHVDLSEFCFSGELSLDGSIKPIKGVLSMAITAKQQGLKTFVVPYDNKDEAGVVAGLSIIAVKNLKDVVDFLVGDLIIDEYEVDIDKLFNSTKDFDVDFEDVKGQENTKRALEIAASGGHNVIILGDNTL